MSAIEEGKERARTRHQRRITRGERIVKEMHIHNLAWNDAKSLLASSAFSSASVFLKAIKHRTTPKSSM